MIAAQYDRQEHRRGTKSTRPVDERCARKFTSPGYVFLKPVLAGLEIART